MERLLRKSHVLCLNEQNSSGDAREIFVDRVSDLEHIGNHGVNIVDAFLINPGKNSLKHTI